MKREVNNQVNLSGTVVSEKLTFSHEAYGEKFYIFELAVKRLSNVEDIIPILIVERSPMFSKIRKHEYLNVKGVYYSRLDCINNKSKVTLIVMAKKIRIIDSKEKNLNEIILNGMICKPVIYRETLNGKKITDMILKVNHSCKIADYIPCIAWGNNAIQSAKFKVGDKIRIIGRIQSREYIKKLSETEEEQKIAYEVSISKIEVLK